MLILLIQYGRNRRHVRRDRGQRLFVLTHEIRVLPATPLQEESSDYKVARFNTLVSPDAISPVLVVQTKLSIERNYVEV